MDMLHQYNAELNNTLPNHSVIIKEFFQTDKASEIIESLNTNVESILFSENCPTITLEMRVHIVNQLRAATLISKLNDCFKGIN